MNLLNYYVGVLNLNWSVKKLNDWVITRQQFKLKPPTPKEMYCTVSRWFVKSCMMSNSLAPTQKHSIMCSVCFVVNISQEVCLQLTLESVETQLWVTKAVRRRIPGRRVRNGKTPTTETVQSVARIWSRERHSSWIFSPSPSFPSSPFLPLFFLLLYPFPPFPSFRSRTPWIQLRGLGERCELPHGAQSQPRSNLLHFSLKNIWWHHFGPTVLQYAFYWKDRVAELYNCWIV